MCRGWRLGTDGQAEAAWAESSAVLDGARVQGARGQALTPRRPELRRRLAVRFKLSDPSSMTSRAGERIIVFETVNPDGEGSIFLAHGHTITAEDFREQLEALLDGEDLARAQAMDPKRGWWSKSKTQRLTPSTFGELWAEVPQGTPGALAMTSIRFREADAVD